MINVTIAKFLADEKNNFFEEKAFTSLKESIEKRIKENAENGFYFCKILTEIPIGLDSVKYENIIEQVLKEVDIYGFETSYKIMDTVERRYQIKISWEE